MARKRHASHENHERWLVSYADFITLLFAFFVVMFASSQADKGRAQQVSASVADAFDNGPVSGKVAALAKVLGGTVDDVGQGNAMMKGPGGTQKAAKEPPNPIVELYPSYRALTKDLGEEIKSGKVEVSLEARGLVVSLRQAAFFPSGTDVIDPTSLPILEKLAQTLLSLSNPIRLEGHTDSIPIHNTRFKSNWELSAARSIAMLEVLTTRFNVPANRFAIVGCADTMPVASNDDEAGRGRNRRVDLVIVSQLTKQPAPGQTVSKPSPVSGSTQGH
jgi:chemotaxis protein MotB